jgi:serine/threonine-protein kinase
VVVKRILPANCEDPEFMRMFTAEARILGMLHHPNVVQVYDFARPTARCSWCSSSSTDLRSAGCCGCCAARGGPVPVAIAAHFAREICRALDYVHGLRGSDGRSAERHPPRRHAVERRADVRRNR